MILCSAKSAFQIQIAFNFIVSNLEEFREYTVLGPPLFGLHPNGLFTFGLSLIGLQGYLDYRHLDYL